MARTKLHDDWERMGPIGNTSNGCVLTVGHRRISVTSYEDGKRGRTYLLDAAYSNLIKQAYALGLAQKPLVP